MPKHLIITNGSKAILTDGSLDVRRLALQDMPFVLTFRDGKLWLTFKTSEGLNPQFQIRDKLTIELVDRE